eukprot:8114660-Pyramimonas_sp.AAC.1
MSTSVTLGWWWWWFGKAREQGWFSKVSSHLVERLRCLVGLRRGLMLDKEGGVQRDALHKEADPLAVLLTRHQLLDGKSRDFDAVSRLSMRAAEHNAY